MQVRGMQPAYYLFISPRASTDEVHFNPEEGGYTILRNVGIRPPHYTMQKPKKQRKPQITVHLFCSKC